MTTTDVGQLHCIVVHGVQQALSRNWSSGSLCLRAGLSSPGAGLQAGMSSTFRWHPNSGDPHKKSKHNTPWQRVFLPSTRSKRIAPPPPWLSWRHARA